MIYIVQLRDHGFSALFTKKDVSLIDPTNILKVTCNTDNGLYYMNLQSCNQSPVSPIPPYSPFSNNADTHSIIYNIVQYLHQSAFSPVVMTWTAAITSGFFTKWPGLTSTLVRKHLPKSLATAKVHLRQDQKNVLSTRTTSTTTPISNSLFMMTLPLPLQEYSVRTQMEYL